MRGSSVLQLTLYLLVLNTVSAIRQADACAQGKPQPTDLPKDADVKREISQLTSEIEKLRSPKDAPEAWKELLAIQKQLEALERMQTAVFSYSSWLHELRSRRPELGSSPGLAFGFSQDS